MGNVTAAISEVVATLDPLIAQKNPPTSIVVISGAEMKLPAKYLKSEKTSSTTLPFSMIIPAIMKSGKQVNGKLSTALKARNGSCLNADSPINKYRPMLPVKPKARNTGIPLNKNIMDIKHIPAILLTYTANMRLDIEPTKKIIMETNGLFRKSFENILNAQLLEA